MFYVIKDYIYLAWSVFNVCKCMKSIMSAVLMMITGLSEEEGK